MHALLVTAAAARRAVVGDVEEEPKYNGRNVEQEEAHKGNPEASAAAPLDDFDKAVIWLILAELGHDKMELGHDKMLTEESSKSEH